MEEKKTYQRPRITDSVKLEAIAGACAGGKGPGGGGGCATFINS
jgi:hypothetical protein